MNSVSWELSGEKKAIARVMSGDAFFTVIPCCCTSCGSVGWAIAIRFCTCTCATSRFVPTLNVTVRFRLPVLVDWLDMYSMFSTPLICSSIGVATVLATVSALAPGYDVLTVTVGGAISGYWAIGRNAAAIPPPMMVTTDSTMAKTGRSMKKCAILTCAPPVMVASRVVRPAGWRAGRRGSPGRPAPVRQGTPPGSEPRAVSPWPRAAPTACR